MLDLSVIHSPGMHNGQHNVGRILEAMLYYDRVHLILNAQTFSGLWAALGPGDLKALLNHSTITSTITPEHLGIFNNNRNGVLTHSQAMFKLSGKAGKLIHEKDDIGSLLAIVRNLPNSEDLTRNKIEKIIKNSSRARYETILGGWNNSASRLLSLVEDAETLKMFLRGWAVTNKHAINEAALDKCKIEIIDMGGEFFISSSILMGEIISGWDNENGWGLVISSVQDYSIDLHLSNSFSADIITTPEISEVASERLDLSLQRGRKSSEQISLFEKMVFDEAHIFADAYNDGMITFLEAMKIIDDSRKFRAWLKNLPPDSSLIKEYQKAISKETLLSKLPVSLLRFAMFNSAGMIADAHAPGSGVIASAIDTYVVEKLFGGWRPNIFVKNVEKKINKAKERSFLS
jgi:hypothetical protein